MHAEESSREFDYRRAVRKIKALRAVAAVMAGKFEAVNINDEADTRVGR